MSTYALEWSRDTDVRPMPVEAALLFVTVGVTTPKLLQTSRIFVHHVRVAMFARRRHSTYGRTFKSDVELHRRAYAAGFSFHHKAPLWVSMIICESSTTPHATREPGKAFAIDPQVAPNAQPEVSAFRGTRFDRGHMAARHSAAFCPAADSESFYMTNVVAQDSQLNRRSWSMLEKRIRQWSVEHGKLGIVTGPVFSAQPKRIGNDVSVPDAFYVAVTCIANPKHSIAFYIPNRNCDWSEVVQGMMSVRALESRTRGRIFRSVPLWKRPWFWHRWSVDSNFWRL